MPTNLEECSECGRVYNVRVTAQCPSCSVRRRRAEVSDADT